MTSVEWLQHSVVSVKDVLAKLDAKEESPIDGLVKELKKLPKRKSLVFAAVGEPEQKKMVGRLNQLFMRRKLTGQFSVQKDAEGGSVYVYKRRKNGGK